MSSKGGKKKRARRLPAIVPRFLKGVATIGAIPTLAAACEKGPPRVQPVVAQYSAPVVAQYVSPPVVAAFMPADAQQPDAALTQQRIPVVAAYVHRPPPPVPRDAGVRKSSKVDAAPQAIAPPPPVVAAYAPPNLGPAVVAAYVPHPTPIQKPKTKKQ